MKQTKLHIVLFTMALLIFVSCDRRDGDWDPMKWRTDAPMVNNVVPVSAEGGTYRFECTNYNSYWLSSAQADGEYFYPDRERNEYKTIIGEWFDVKVEGNVMEVTIAPNDDAANRELEVTPQAGNAFYTFWFEQDGVSLPLR